MAYKYIMAVVAIHPNEQKNAIAQTIVGAIVGDAECVNHSLSIGGFPKIKKNILDRLWVVEPKNEGYANLPIDFAHNDLAKTSWKKDCLFLKIERLSV